jgi:hypothetical protein
MDIVFISVPILLVLLLYIFLRKSLSWKVADARLLSTALVPGILFVWSTIANIFVLNSLDIDESQILVAYTTVQLSIIYGAGIWVLIFAVPKVAIRLYQKKEWKLFALSCFFALLPMPLAFYLGVMTVDTEKLPADIYTPGVQQQGELSKEGEN